MRPSGAGLKHMQSLLLYWHATGVRLTVVTTQNCWIMGIFFQLETKIKHTHWPEIHARSSHFNTTPLSFRFLFIFYDISRLTWRCAIFSCSYLADPFNDGEVNPPEATVSFCSLLKGHWTPELLKTVQSKEMPTLSPCPFSCSECVHKWTLHDRVVEFSERAKRLWVFYCMKALG